MLLLAASEGGEHAWVLSVQLRRFNVTVPCLRIVKGTFQNNAESRILTHRKDDWGLLHFALYQSEEPITKNQREKSLAKQQ